MSLCMCNANTVIGHHGGAARHYSSLQAALGGTATLFISKHVRRPSTSICATWVTSIMHQLWSASAAAAAARTVHTDTSYRLSDTQLIWLCNIFPRGVAWRSSRSALSVTRCLLQPDIPATNHILGRTTHMRQNFFRPLVQRCHGTAKIAICVLFFLY